MFMPGRRIRSRCRCQAVLRTIQSDVDIVHFYNTRDVPGAGRPPREVAVNINAAELGNLGLNHGEELAMVAFLKTLSDGYVPK